MPLLSVPRRLVSVTAALALLAMTIIGASAVIGSMLNRPLSGAHEIIETLMVIVIFLGIAKAEEQNRHVAVSLVIDTFPDRIRILLKCLGSLISGILFLLIAYFAWAEALRSFGVGERQAGEIMFPLWPARMLLAAGSSMMVAQCAMKIYADALYLLGFSSDSRHRETDSNSDF